MIHEKVYSGHQGSHVHSAAKSNLWLLKAFCKIKKNFSTCHVTECHSHLAEVLSSRKKNLRTRLHTQKKKSHSKIGVFSLYSWTFGLLCSASPHFCRFWVFPSWLGCLMARMLLFFDSDSFHSVVVSVRNKMFFLSMQGFIYILLECPNWHKPETVAVLFPICFKF